MRRLAWLGRLLGGRLDRQDVAPPPEPPGPSTPLGKVDRKKRVRVQVGVDLHTQSNFFVGTSLNLSEGGLFVATRSEVPVGSEVDLGFTLPGGATLQVRGVVRWRRAADERTPLATSGVGIQFVDASEQALAEVRAFIEQRDPLVYGEE